MNPAETRKLGKSGIELTQLGFGSAPLGELFHGPLLPIAMAVQFAVSFLGAIAIRWSSIWNGALAARNWTWRSWS